MHIFLKVLNFNAYHVTCVGSCFVNKFKSLFFHRIQASSGFLQANLFFMNPFYGYLATALFYA